MILWLKDKKFQATLFDYFYRYVWSLDTTEKKHTLHSFSKGIHSPQKEDMK